MTQSLPGISGPAVLRDYLDRHGVRRAMVFNDGALVNTVRFPLAAVETEGAILFADLPGYSLIADEMGAVAASYVANHFFAWFEGEAGRHFDGVVERFVGDAVLVVFLHDLCHDDPMRLAMRTAHAMLDFDPYMFAPKIGIASGEFAVSVVGTESNGYVSVVGHAPNLAARCVQAVATEAAIRIASNDHAAIASVFGSAKWTITGDVPFEPKNLERLLVTDVERLTMWVTMDDRREAVRKAVALAREAGAIVSTTPAVS